MIATRKPPKARAANEEILSSNEELQSTMKSWKPPKRSYSLRMRN
jgi:hypothetical protein